MEINEGKGIRRWSEPYIGDDAYDPVHNSVSDFTFPVDTVAKPEDIHGARYVFDHLQVFEEAPIPQAEEEKIGAELQDNSLNDSSQNLSEILGGSLLDNSRLDNELDSPVE